MVIVLVEYASTDIVVIMSSYQLSLINEENPLLYISNTDQCVLTYSLLTGSKSNTHSTSITIASQSMEFTSMFQAYTQSFYVACFI